MLGIGLEFDPFDRLIAGLDRAARFDLRPVAERLRGRLVEGNRRGLLAGTDADGSATAPLAESTLADPRRGPGPPRVPDDAASRLIADFAVGIDAAGRDRFEVTGHWPNTPFVKFHRGPDSRTGRPARDPVGVRPDDLALIGRDARDAAELLLRF